MKRTLSLLLATGLTISACIPSAPTDQELRQSGIDACFSALEEANAKTENLPDVVHEDNPEFILQEKTENQHIGTMTWEATIKTKSGIPWSHKATCYVDVSTDPVTVNYLNAHNGIEK